MIYIFTPTDVGLLQKNGGMLQSSPLYTVKSGAVLFCRFWRHTHLCTRLKRVFCNIEDFCGMLTPVHSWRRCSILNILAACSPQDKVEVDVSYFSSMLTSVHICRSRRCLILKILAACSVAHLCTEL